MVDNKEEEEAAKQEINEEYLRKMFKRSAEADGEESKEEKQKRLDLLNEYLQDQFLERFGSLLTKQFAEKEQSIKALVNRYMDSRLVEISAIKANFKLECDKLESLLAAGDLKDANYQMAKKVGALKEAEMLRQIDLNLEKAQKDEDASLRTELDKKHLNEQVEFRKMMAEA